MMGESSEETAALVRVGAGRPRVTAILVRLTDTSLKALKAEQKAGAKSLHLDLGQNEEELVLGEQRFKLAVNDIARDVGQGRQDVVSCLGENQLASLGNVRERIQVLATKDTFEETRQKAIQLQVEEQKKAGKELKMKHGLKKKSHHSEQLGGHDPGAPSRPKPPDLTNKTLRQRIIHLLILKSLVKNELIERLLRNGKLSDSDSASCASLIKELTTASGDKLVLKPSLYKEVDLNWPTFTAFDRQCVRRKLDGSRNGSAISAGKTPKTATTTKNPGGGSVLDDLLPPRKRPTPPHYESSSGPPSVSPPIPKPPEPPAAKTKKVEAPPPPPPPTPPPPPASDDWDSTFPECRTAEERNDYAQAFQQEYQEYMRCYERLSEVSKEFSRLENRLKKPNLPTKDKLKIEEEITSKYNKYNSDEAFSRTRRRHEELRGKLAVLKARVRTFDDLHLETPMPLAQLQNRSEDLTVM